MSGHPTYQPQNAFMKWMEARLPIAHEGQYQGFFCPCHGSVYDTSGRIRQGPAPTNLAVPPYAFVSDTKIRIG